MADQRNLIMAIVISLAILVGWTMFFEQSLVPPPPPTTEQQAGTPQAPAGDATVPVPTAPTGAPAVPGMPPTADPSAVRDAALAEVPRIRIETPRLSGSISLRDGRIDDLTLNDYKVSQAPDSPDVTLLSPRGSQRPYFARFGWVAPAETEVALPDGDTVWTANRDVLTPETPVTLTWDNGAGLRFVRVYELDKDYMFTIRQRIVNNSDQSISLHPFGLVQRTGQPDTFQLYILHEGPIGVLNETLDEVDYDDVQEAGSVEYKTPNGWIGITDKYWLTALVPDQGSEFTAAHRYLQGDRFQSDYLRNLETVPAGGSAEVVNRLFAGAKVVNLLDSYRDRYDVPLFDRAVDFGWFFFLTIPLFHVLHYFYLLIGNFGLAILLLTVCVKLVFFPLANKSYKAMSKMKALAPEMTKLRDKYGDDRQKMNQELMALYKKEKVNPASGCLPILIQIPVFFALYKVLYVTIEMRHAPFYGWIQDLSAPDPTTIFNLFGLIPWSPPDFLMLGIWPLLMGISMFAQQKLNPQPTDPVQAKVFLLMPILFTFLLAQFPAGLVIYWTWNNLLSMAQQYVIMKRMGVPIGNS